MKGLCTQNHHLFFQIQATLAIYNKTMELSEEIISKIRDEVILECFEVEENEAFKVFPKLTFTIQSLTHDEEKQKQFAREISMEFSKINHIAIGFGRVERIWSSETKQTHSDKLKFDDVAPLNQKSFYVYPKITSAAQIIMKACDNLENNQMLFIGNSCMIFDEFAEKLKEKFHASKVFLVNWRKLLIQNLYKELKPIGIGWYDLDISNWETYMMAKLYRFMQKLKLMIEESLRTMIENSMNNFLQFLTKPCESLIENEDGFVWEGSLIVSPFAHFDALFQLTLIIDALGVRFSCEPMKFLDISLKHMDEVILNSHFVPQIDPEIIRNLIFDNQNYSSIGLMDDEFLELKRKYLKFCYEKSNMTLISYAKRYDEHVDFYLSYMDEYLKGFTQSGTTVIQLKEEILYNIKMRDYVQNTMPESIIIGPYFIQTMHIKAFLLKKRKVIINKLMQILNDLIRDKTFVIVDSYRKIFSRLTDPPANIIELTETQTWMDSIPTLVKVNEESMKLVLYDYDILEEFHYNLTNNDFSLKWEGLQWPLRILKQINQTHENQVLDIERFKKEQTSELVMFDSTIEALNAEVANFRFLHDTNEATKMSKQCKNVTEKIGEAIEKSQELKHKQNLLKLPELDFSHLEEMLEAFNPYFVFWQNAAELQSQTSYVRDKPIRFVNLEVVNHNLSRIASEFDQLYSKFEDVPKIQALIPFFKDKISDLQVKVGLLESLQNYCWTKFCYERFQEKTNCEISYTKEINFGTCLDAGMWEHFDMVQQILSFSIDEDIKQKEEERIIQEKLLAEEEIVNKRRMRRLMRTDI